jgi:nucleotide-binding universal stress UspA family protein
VRAERPEPGDTAKDGPSGIVVGFDGSGPSRDALAYAAGAARRNHSWLVVVYVTSTPVLASVSPEVLAATYQAADDHRAQLERDVHAIDETGVDWELVLRQGEPAHELERVAEERKADTIVVGRSSSRAHTFIGSVPIRLVRISRRPTVVVP